MASTDKKKRWISAKEVKRRYNASDMSLWRWGRDPELNFPIHVYIKNRKFWDEAELDEFDAALVRAALLHRSEREDDEIIPVSTPIPVAAAKQPNADARKNQSPDRDQDPSLRRPPRQRRAEEGRPDSQASVGASMTARKRRGPEAVILGAGADCQAQAVPDDLTPAPEHLPAPAVDVDTLMAEIKAILNRDQPQRGDRLRRMLIIQDELAVEFGRRRGWRRSSRFLVEELATSWPEDARDHVGVMLDHAYLYRDVDGRPVAIVAHLYDLDQDAIEEIDAACDALGIAYATPDDFPSWWYPGETRLVVYTRRGS